MVGGNGVTGLARSLSCGEQFKKKKARKNGSQNK